MKEDKKTKHPSYGMIGFSRISCGNQRLFGSPIEHDTMIALRVHTAYRTESFGYEHIYADEDIVEVMLSPAQFSELLTTMNMGDGVPCTIRFDKENGHIKQPESYTNVRETSERYLEEAMEELSKRLDKLLTLASDIAESKTASKKSRTELFEAATMVKTQLVSNLPFVHKTFGEQMDKTVSEAKANVDALITTAVTKLGLEKLEDIKLLSDK